MFKVGDVVEFRLYDYTMDCCDHIMHVKGVILQIDQSHSLYQYNIYLSEPIWLECMSDSYEPFPLKDAKPIPEDAVMDFKLFKRCTMDLKHYKQLSFSREDGRTIRPMHHEFDVICVCEGTLEQGIVISEESDDGWGYSDDSWGYFAD